MRVSADVNSPIGSVYMSPDRIEVFFYGAPLLCHAHSNLGLQGGTCCSSGEIAGVGRVITFSILPSRLGFGYCHKEVVVLTPMFTSLLPLFKKTAIALYSNSELFVMSHWAQKTFGFPRQEPCFFAFIKQDASSTKVSVFFSNEL